MTGAAGPAAVAGVPVRVTVADAAAMRRLGARVAGLLRAGDLVVLTGPLGAGKTTFAQGVGVGLGVGPPLRSPTFVLARVHRGGRLPVVHADAYRLTAAADPAGELDQLDLDATAAESVTLLEWGEGLAERLSGDRLQVLITPAGRADGADGPRTVALMPFGPRWAGVELAGRL